MRGLTLVRAVRRAKVIPVALNRLSLAVLGPVDDIRSELPARAEER